MSEQKEKVPLMEGLWVENPLGDTRLLGSKCFSCGELYFPKKSDNAICSHCQHHLLEEIKLSNRGKISSFTVVYISPAGGFYKGPVPFAFGFVELPEGIKVESQFTGINFENLEIGMEVVLIIEKLFDDENEKEIISYKFQPIIS